VPVTLVSDKGQSHINFYPHQQWKETLGRVERMQENAGDLLKEFEEEYKRDDRSR